MVPQSKMSWLIRVRNALCYSFLILALFCEGYSAVAIGFEQFAPSWYNTLGWFLLILPAALAVGLLFICTNRRRLGFYLCATSLLLYVALIFLDAYMGDRKSTRLNSSHVEISYAVFCLKK